MSFASTSNHTTVREGIVTLLGPYESHAEAMENVKRGRELAIEHDRRSVFDGFGTTQAPERKTVFGL
jgi:hypothetical protein